MSRTLSLVALLMAASSTLACSSSSSSGGNGGCDTGGADGGTCTEGQTPDFHSCADLTTPTVSFAKDIQPLFNSSCAISGATCHGNPNAASTEAMTGQVYLGLNGDAGVPDSAAVLSGIVGFKSPENPGMDIVKPGDPANSYMMHKLDYDECQYASTCNGTKIAPFVNCGLGMPYNSGTLDVPTRDTIRRWIAQGAKNN